MPAINTLRMLEAQYPELRHVTEILLQLEQNLDTTIALLNSQTRFVNSAGIDSYTVARELTERRARLRALGAV